MKFIDLTNKKINHWKVLKRVENDSTNKPQFLCKCDCSTVQIVRAKTLRENTSKGCRKCMPRRTAKSNRFEFRHGMSRTPTYKIWAYMIARCHNPKDTGYKWYGAKGITVCQRWRDDFLNFLEDMDERPPAKTIDRIDNFKGYSKENCKWSTIKEQNSNKRQHQLSRLS